MATQDWSSLFQTDSDKKKSTGAQSTDLSGQQPSTQSQATVGGASPVMGTQATQAQPKQAGTGFTNIQKIAGANVGAGGQMAQKLGQQGQQMSAAAQAVQSQQQKNISDITNLQKSQQTGAQETLGVIKPSDSTQLDLSKIANIGPDVINYATGNVPNYTQQATQAQQAAMQNTAGLVGNVGNLNTALQSEGGTASALQNVLRGKGGGKSALDIALLQAQGQPELTTQRNQLSQYLSDINKAQQNIKGATGEISSLAKRDQDLRQSLIDAAKETMGAEGGETGILGAQAKEIAAKQTADKDLLESMKSQLTGTTGIGEDFAKQMEIDPNIGTYGANDALLKAMVAGQGWKQPDYKLSDVLDKNEIGALGKLQQLQGVQQKDLKYGEATTPEKAGINAAMLKDIITGRKQQISGELSKAGLQPLAVEDLGKGVQQTAEGMKQQAAMLEKGKNDAAYRDSDEYKSLVRGASTNPEKMLELENFLKSYTGPTVVSGMDMNSPENRQASAYTTAKMQWQAMDNAARANIYNTYNVKQAEADKTMEILRNAGAVGVGTKTSPVTGTMGARMTATPKA